MTRPLSFLLLAGGALLMAACGNGRSSAAPGSAIGDTSALSVRREAKPKASSVVLVIMENRDYGLIVGSPHAPYINGTLVPQAALMTNSHAVTHPSEPNYVAIFSGSTQGVRDDSCPHSFKAANLGAEVITAGATFDGYSESMPKDGFRGCYYGNLYARKHNPWVNFTNVPPSSNLVWHDLPKVPPTVSFVVPNLCNDMHDCSTRTGDNWLKANLPAIIAYDADNNGLLILTWDEAAPDSNGKNQIATLLIGPMIVPGKYSQEIDHYAVLRTVESILNVACTANACKAPLIKGIWK